MPGTAAVVYAAVGEEGDDDISSLLSEEAGTVEGEKSIEGFIAFTFIV